MPEQQATPNFESQESPEPQAEPFRPGYEEDTPSPTEQDWQALTKMPDLPPATEAETEADARTRLGDAEEVERVQKLNKTAKTLSEEHSIFQEARRNVLANNGYFGGDD